MNIKKYKINPMFPYIYVIYDIEMIENSSFRKKLFEIFKHLKNTYEYVLWNCSYIYENQNYKDDIELILNSKLVIFIITENAYKSTYLCQILNADILEGKRFFNIFLDDSNKEDLINGNVLFKKLFENPEVIYKKYDRNLHLYASIDSYNIDFKNISIKFKKEIKVYAFQNKKYKQHFLLDFFKKIPSNKKINVLKKIQDFDEVICSKKDYQIILILPFLDNECIDYLFGLFKKNPRTTLTIFFNEYFHSWFDGKLMLDKRNILELRKLIKYFTSNYPNVNFIGDVFFSNYDGYFNFFYSNKELINKCEFKIKGEFAIQDDFKLLQKKMRKNFIFVSYSHKNEEYVKSKIDYLKDGLKFNIIIDYDYFLENNFLTWKDQTSALISNKRCIAVLAFKSKNFNSDSIDFEIDLIKKNEKKMIVINLDESVNERILELKNVENHTIEELPHLFKEIKISKNRDIDLIKEIILLVILFALFGTFPIYQGFSISSSSKWWDVLYYVVVATIITSCSIFSFLIPLNINRDYQKYNFFFYFIQVGVSVAIFFFPHFHLQYLYINSFLLYEGVFIILGNLIRIIKRKSIKAISLVRMVIFLLLLLALLMLRFLHQ